MSDMMEYKCPNCGGALEFNTSVQTLKCPYCDTEFDMEVMKEYNEGQQKATSSNMEWENEAGGEWQSGETEGMRVFVCQSCAGEIVGDENTGATSCPYCGNPIVMKGQFSGDLRPDYVIPFKLDKKAAKKALEDYLSDKKFIPKIFKDKGHIDEIKGIYVPYWLFDADVDADIQYKATRVHHWSDSDYNYTETKYYSVYRSGQMGFERIAVDGSSKMPDDLMESIEPFDFKEAVDFNTAYLAGYLADKYDVNSDESVLRANQRVKESAEEILASSVNNYNSVVPESTSINISNGSIKYALYPVWLLNTNWEGKLYTFAMNGQTGKFIGDLPIDHNAIRNWQIRTTLLIGAGMYAVAYLLWFLGIF